MTGQPMRLLNVKCPDWLIDLVETATTLSRAKDKSHWVREALEAGARREIAEHHAEQARSQPDGPPPTQPPSRIALRGVHRGSYGRVLPSGCQHPPTAVLTGVEYDVCLLCGTRTRKRI